MSGGNNRLGLPDELAWQVTGVTGEPGRRENPVAEGGEVGQRLALGGKIEWGEKWSGALVGDDDFLQRVM